MRILHVQLKHTYGGVLQAFLDYTRLLRYSDNQVQVITTPYDPFYSKLQETGFNVMKSKMLGALGPFDVFTINYFKKIIKEFKPDVILTHEGKTGVLMKKSAGNSIPVITVNHGGALKRFKDTDAAIVVNKIKQKEARNFLGVGHPIFYLPNSISLEGDDFPPNQKLSNNESIIGVIGRLAREKAFDIFIDALNILNNRNVKFSAVIAGDGKERDALEELIQKYELQTKIKMLGWVKNPDAFYRTIDIFCFPSRFEPFGLVLLEAYKHGLPAVVSDADGPADIVENNVDALMVPKENALALADALQKLIENKELADNLAAAGYKKLVSNYSVPVVAPLLQEILEEVAFMHKEKVSA